MADKIRVERVRVSLKARSYRDGIRKDAYRPTGGATALRRLPRHAPDEILAPDRRQLRTILAHFARRFKHALRGKGSSRCRLKISQLNSFHSSNVDR